MLEENERRAQALIRRVTRRDDYGTLLMQGEVRRSIHNLEDPEAWRADLRSQARKDKLRIVTGRSETGVFAALRRSPDDEDLMAFSPETQQWLHTVHPAHESAERLGHHWLLVRDGREGAVVCKRCEARGYINAEHHVVDGELFEVPCPDAE